MSLTTKEIEHLASLAKLQLTPAEIEEFSKQLGVVLDYIGKLQELSGQIESSNELSEANWRTDEVYNWPEVNPLLKSSAAVENNMIVVPEVFTDKD